MSLVCGNSGRVAHYRCKTRLWVVAGKSLKEKAVDGESTVEIHIERKPSGMLRDAGLLARPALRRQALKMRLEGVAATIGDSANAAWSREKETGLIFNFSPVLIAAGILIYFAAPAEPSAIALVLVAVPGFYALTRIQSRGFAYTAIWIITLLLAGMGLAKIAVERSDAPIITQQMTTIVAGTVLEVQSNRRGAPRYVLKPHAVKGMDANELPPKLRLSSSSKKVRFPPGATIKGRARLQPVSGPVFPGGHDFAFFSRFKGLGGSGFFMGAPSPAEFAPELSFANRASILINAFRHSVAKRIEAALPGPQGKVATALVIGDKTGIPQDIQQALRATGLAHILAISGLHMALVTLTVIWIARLALSLNSGLVSSRPTKKWAALIGFTFATVYLGMSGAGVATQRAWIMISVMLCAVLLDRPAITLRSVGISALLIMMLDPSSIISPGFQMSFAAVVALVSAYEALNRRARKFPKQEKTQLPLLQPIVKAQIYIGGLALTSMIAGTATSFIAAWHFHQFAPLGLLANVLAMPIVSLLVMPGVLLSIVLMPFGLEVLALYPVSHGLDWIVAIAKWVEGLTPLNITGKLPMPTIAMFGLGLVVLCLLKTRLRLLGLVPLAAIPALYKTESLPDALIAENGRVAAYRHHSGDLHQLYPKRGNFVTEVWAKAIGKPALKKSDLPEDACNRERCIVLLKKSKVMHIVYDPDLLRSSCQRADILIAPRLRWVNCRQRKPALILKRGDFEMHGTHAIYIKDTENRYKPKIVVQRTIPPPTRPWHTDRRSKDEPRPDTESSDTVE